MSKKVPTKEKIYDAALALFNHEGIKNVRLQHIADRVGISVGNLAYHFPEMKRIIQGLERKIESDIRTKAYNWKDSAHLIDFDNRLIGYFYMMKKYSFYFLDAIEIERSYPMVHAKRLAYITHLIQEIKDWLLINKRHDTIAPFDDAQHLDDLAEMIWFIIAFWLSKNKILDKPDRQELAFRIAIWNQIAPHFTEKGKIEYEVIIHPKLVY